MSTRLRSLIKSTPLTMGLTLTGAVMWWAAGVAGPATLNDFSPTLPKAAQVSQSTTGRVKVDRCIAALKAAHKEHLSEESVDRAQVTCSKVTKDKDAEALYRWVRNGHKDALQIIG
jgi:hypothetical protein